MTLQKLLEKHLKGECLKTTLNLNEYQADVDLNDAYEEFDTIPIWIFSEADNDSLYSLFNDKFYPELAETIINGARGSYDFTDVQLSRISFADAALEKVLFGASIVDIGLTECRIKELELHDCAMIDFIGINECEIEKVFIDNCDITMFKIDSSSINEINVEDTKNSEFVSINMKDIERCTSLQDFMNKVFAKKHLIKGDDSRGLASIFDTGLFDFKK